MSSLYLSAKDILLAELNKHFSPALKMGDRINIISDLQMFLPEDPLIWAEKKGKAPEHLQVYFDGVHICTFNEDDIKEAVMLMFWRGFNEQYKQGRIRLTPPELRPEEKKESTLDKVKKIKATTPVEKMAKDILINHAKKGQNGK